MNERIKPEIDVRHMRIHLRHDGADYVIYAKQQLGTTPHYGRAFYRAVEHVLVSPTGEHFHGSEYIIDRSKIVLQTEITSREYCEARGEQ